MLEEITSSAANYNNELIQVGMNLADVGRMRLHFTVLVEDQSVSECTIVAEGF